MPDTIAAIATPQLPSAIGILRLSGPDTRRILDVVFSPAHGGPVSGQAPRRMVLGDLHDRQGRIIDSALAVLFPAPTATPARTAPRSTATALRWC